MVVSVLTARYINLGHVSAQTFPARSFGPPQHEKEEVRHTDRCHLPEGPPAGGVVVLIISHHLMCRHSNPSDDFASTHLVSLSQSGCKSDGIISVVLLVFELIDL